MATTKTLAPTNQTITIDVFQGEKPDHRHIADAEGKLADAVNALNSQMAKHIKLDSNDTTWANIWAKLNTLSNGETATFTSTASAATSALTGNARSTTMQGIVSRYSSSQFEFLVKYPANQFLMFRVASASSSSSGTYTDNTIAKTEEITFTTASSGNYDLGSTWTSRAIISIVQDRTNSDYETGTCLFDIISHASYAYRPLIRVTDTSGNVQGSKNFKVRITYVDV